MDLPAMAIFTLLMVECKTFETSHVIPTSALYTAYKDTTIRGASERYQALSLLECTAKCNVVAKCFGVSFNSEEGFCDVVVNGHAGTTTAPSKGWRSAIKYKTCPTRFEMIGWGCYFVQKTKVKITGDDGKSACEAMYGSALASVETLEEFEALKNYLLGIYGAVLADIKNGWMLSATRTGGAGPFTWATGSQLAVSAQEWVPGQPDTQNCMGFDPPTFYYYDILCSAYERQFICEL